MSAFITLVTMTTADTVLVNVDNIAYVEPRRTGIGGNGPINGSVVKMVGPVGHQLIVTPHPIDEVAELIAEALNRPRMSPVQN